MRLSEKLANSPVKSKKDIKAILDKYSYTDDIDAWVSRNPEALLSANTGICFDTAALQDKLLSDLGITHRNMFAVSKDSLSGKNYTDPSHTFVLHKDTDGLWKWLEGSWEPYRHNKLSAKTSNKLAKQIKKLMEKDNGKSYTLHSIEKYPEEGLPIGEYYMRLLSQAKKSKKHNEKRASATKFVKAAATKRLPIPSFADIESSMGITGNNTPTTAEPSRPAFGELDLSKGKTPNPGGSGGSYDTMQALQHAYGNAPKKDVEQLVAHANKMRSGNRQLYSMHNVPTRVPYTYSNDAADAYAARSLRLPVGAARFMPASLTGWITDGDINEPYAVSDVRNKPEQGDIRNPAVVHESGSTWRGEMADPENALDPYDGAYNPYTYATVDREESPFSMKGHEFTHALNWPYFKSERGTSFPGQLRAAYDTNKAHITKMYPDAYKQYRSTYNAYSDAEATQNAAQMKRIAYAKFYRDNGRFPRGYNEISNAYRAVTRYKVVDPNNPHSDPTPVANPEHARFINEMVPTDPNLTPEQRQKAYDTNVNNWINTMMRKDKDGNFYQDSLVRNNSTMGKIASFADVKSIYDSLPEEQKLLVSPRGRFVDSPNLQLRVLNGDKTGFAEAYKLKGGPKDSAFVTLAVSPEAQGKGVGKEVLQQLIARAKAMRIKKLIYRLASENDASRALVRKFVDKPSKIGKDFEEYTIDPAAGGQR